MSTIYALSSGRPPAAIAVLRISGPAAQAAGEALAGTLPSPRRAGLRTLRDADGAILDRVLCLWFPGPATATGESLLEFHAHGGRAVIEAIETALSAMPGLRAAEPGEFTRRALASGRIDLAQANGLADLLLAETEQERRAALLSSEGRLSAQVRGWLARLSSIGAMIEGSIDFDEEGDVAPLDHGAIQRAAEAIIADLDLALRLPPVERLQEGVRVVFSGAPNVGKSSLFNALVEREAAIVSPIAGTTRDAVEARIVRSGQIYTLVDTAGLNDASIDPIERIGIQRAQRERDRADLILWLSDVPLAIDRANIWVYPRSDLPNRAVAPEGALASSSRDVVSIERLWHAIEHRTRTIVAHDDILFHRQQRVALAAAHDELRDITENNDVVLQAEAVRRAANALGTILGVNATEAMLDTLFSRFCIGK